MRVNLSLLHTIDGYENTSDISLYNYDSATLNELIIDEMYGAIDWKESNNILINWISKLRLNGKITIINQDIELVLKMYLNGYITTETLNQIIFGTNIPYSNLTALSDVEDILLQHQLKIVKKEIVNTQFIITAQRMK